MKKYHNWNSDPNQNDLSKTNYALGAVNLAELSYFGAHYNSDAACISLRFQEVLLQQDQHKRKVL